MLNEADYRTFITGLPSGIVNVLDNATTGKSFAFSGSADGQLLYTIASLENRPLVESPVAAAPGSAVRLAQDVSVLAIQQAQAASADPAANRPAVPIRWVCQRAEDAQALSSALERARALLTANDLDVPIEVTHRPAHDPATIAATTSPVNADVSPASETTASATPTATGDGDIHGLGRIESTIALQQWSKTKSVFGALLVVVGGFLGFHGVREPSWVLILIGAVLLLVGVGWIVNLVVLVSRGAETITVHEGGIVHGFEKTEQSRQVPWSKVLVEHQVVMKKTDGAIRPMVHFKLSTRDGVQLVHRVVGGDTREGKALTALYQRIIHGQGFGPAGLGA